MLKVLLILKRKKMLPLTKEELKPHIFVGNKNLKKLSKSIIYPKVRNHVHFAGRYRGAVHSICNLKFNMPNEIPVIFHNGSNCDYHLIIKELANEFDGKFECLG